MYKLTDIWKDTLSRIASGEFVDLSTIRVPEQVQDVLERINATKIDLDKDNVFLILKTVNPEVFIGYDKNISNTDIIYLLQQESAKHTITEIERKITQAILKNQNNPLFKWDNLLADIQDNLAKSNSNTRKYTMWDDDIDLASSQGVCSFGYDILDCLDGGGISAGSYTVYYGAWGVGKSTVGTQQIAYRALKQGLKPLVIFLEGNYKKFMAGIKLRLAGFPIDNVEVNWTKYKDQVNEKLKGTNLSFPIVNHGASNRYELDNLLREYKPDVVIYDQITIGSKTREWQDIAKMSETLKKLALETGIPVVAMTQSDESNYGNGADENDNERNKKNCSGGVKYSKAIVEDATTLVHIHHTYPHNTTRRLLSVKKTKDDTLARKGQVTIEVEWTANGLDDIAIIEKDGRVNNRINKAEFLMLNKRVAPLIEKPIEIVTKKEETTIEPVITNKIERDDRRMPDNLIGSYDEMRYETTGARLSIIGEVLNVPSLLDLGVTWDKYHKNTFPQRFLDKEIIDNGVHEPYLYYYHNGNKNKNFDVSTNDADDSEDVLELGA